MSTKVQQERFERTLKQLLRKTENKHCVHCGVLGPTYVVAKYGIFICTQCSAVQRDFARCKSVSMSKFDAEEVEAMKKQGNGYAWRTYLTNWSETKLSRPLESSRDPEKLKRWISQVFEDKKFYEEQSAPPTPSTPTQQSTQAQVSVPSVGVVPTQQPAITPIQERAAPKDFDPFGSLEVPANITVSQPQPSAAQQSNTAFDPFAASHTPPAAQTTVPAYTPDFDPFVTSTTVPTPAETQPQPQAQTTPSSTPTTEAPSSATPRNAALPEDIFSLSVEPTNGVGFGATPFPNANPSPTPANGNVPFTSTPQYFQQTPQPQFSGQMGIPQQQYMYGNPQQYGYGYAGTVPMQYGQVPMTQGQPGFMGHNPQVHQGGNYGGQPNMFASQPPYGFQTQNPMQQQFQQPAQQLQPQYGQQKQKDEFDVFGDLMADIGGKSNGFSSQQQMGQPKSSGNPFA